LSTALIRKVDSLILLQVSQVQPNVIYVGDIAGFRTGGIPAIYCRYRKFWANDFKPLS